MLQQQQGGDNTQQEQSTRNVLVEEKPLPLREQGKTKIYKRKYHHRRRNKYPTPNSVSVAANNVNNSNTIHVTSLSSTHEEPFQIETIAETPQSSLTEELRETPIALTETDVKTDPALPAITKKSPAAQPAVPSTPPIEEEVLPLRRQGDRKGLPYIFSHFLHVRETLAVSLPTSFLQVRLSWRTILAYALLALLLINTALLWQDLTATHLYVSTLDENNGSLHTQQDLSGYKNDVRLTAPLEITDSSNKVMLGVYTPQQNGVQQVLTLQHNSSSISLQRSLSLANGAITHDAFGHLLVESTDGLQVVTQDGQLVWHVQGQQPTHGVHPFAPVSDTATIYTIASVTHSQVAAYTLANGHIRWTQMLPDTLEYAPPFVLDGKTLYVASDHNVFALNSTDGTILWEKPYAARTLLVENEGDHHLLLALSSQGIEALQSDTGNLAWSFRGNPEVRTLPTQFYQGTIGYNQQTSHNIIYATGIVWNIPDVRESVWLYAIDAITGMMRWSHQIVSGPTGTDAGRVLQPLLDTDHNRVIVQHATDKHDIAVTAFDANTGAQRWNTPLPAMNISSPVVFGLSPSTFVAFTTTTNSLTILLTPSFYRTTILLLLFASISGILSLAFLPRQQDQWRIQRIAKLFLWTATSQSHQQNTPVGTDVSRPFGVLHSSEDVIHRSLPTIPIHRKRTYTAVALVLIALCIIATILASIHAHQPAQQVLTHDAQGSVIITDASDSTHQLEAIKADGTTQWTLFNTEGTFSIPEVQTQSGTLLVALQGSTPHTYVVAADDPAYPRPLDSMLALYQLDRSTGHILWQQVIWYPDEQQHNEVVGGDITYMYVAGVQMLASSTQLPTKYVAVPQLFAVNKLTGTIDWRIFGPTQPATTQHITNTVLTQNGQLRWHIANTIFTIDPHVGQIIGRK